MLPSNSRRLFSRQQEFSCLLLAALCLALGVPRAAAQDWPQFRGPSGDGLSSATDVPLTWGGKTNENVLWTADLLGDGIASPIVWKDRVFVVNASRKADDKKIDREYPEQYVACYETKQGKLLWNTIADGAGRIFLASAGTSVVVKAGQEFEVLATNKLGDSNHASPALAGGRLYLAGAKRLYAIGKK